jgi:hypothetical protein
MTLEHLSAMKAAGLGRGRDVNYQSWIRIRRRLTSPVSNLFVLPTPLYALRGLHLLSGLEHRAALLALWLGVKEIREQFPMWPDPHVHPLAGIFPDRDKHLDLAPGLLDIAKANGIKHGNYPTTRIPFVATSDLVLRIGDPPDDRLVFWACKPLELMLKAPRCIRICERLELENLYSSAVNALSVVVDGVLFSTTKLADNLDWLTPLHSEMLSIGTTSRLLEFAGRLSDLGTVTPLREAIHAAGGAVGLEHEESQAHFRMAAWQGLIDIDLTRPVLMTDFMVRGGHDVRRQLAKEYLGVAA